jgi:Mrr N-terminal domain
MPTIRIEDDVFNGLKKLAEPFVDTPNSVIRRLLDHQAGYAASTAIAQPLPGSNGAKPHPIKASRSTAMNLTPQPTYEKFLLYVLANDFNGRAGKQQATDMVLKRMKSQGFLGPADYEEVATGESRCQNTIAWARNALKEQGQIDPGTARGSWELTPAGMDSGRALKLPIR